MPQNLAGQVADALRHRRSALERALTPAETAAPHPDALVLRALDLLIAAIQSRAAGHPGLLPGVRDLASWQPTTSQLLGAVQRCEHAATGALEGDARLGSLTPHWPAALELIHQASFDILAVCAGELAATPTSESVQDGLSSLIVRPVFDLALAHEAGRAHRHQQPLSLILFEVDNLADITAAHGRGIGDRIVERMGVLVRRFFRNHDWVARHGGRSIAVLLPQTSLDDATDLAHHVRTMVEGRLVLADALSRTDTRVRLNAAAVGTALVERTLDPYFIVATAEDAIRRIRASGRSRVERVELPTPFVTLLGAATALECSALEIRRLVRRGDLVAIRNGRHYQIDRASIERYRLTRHAQQPLAAGR